MSVAAPLRAPRRSAAAPSAPAVPAGGKDRRAPLRVVARRPSVAARVPFAILVGVILAGGLVALLMLHTLAAQDAFRLHDLQHESATLADTEQQLTLVDQHNQAPSTLAARARALGMAPTGSLKIERRPDGRVVAVASAVPVPPKPAPQPTAAKATKPTAPANAKPTAAAKAKAKPSPKPTTSSG